MNNILIVGVGNPYRQDDGLGWGAIDLLQKKNIEAITLKKIRAETLELIDLFSQYTTVYVIDAARREDCRDEYLRIDAKHCRLPQENSTSSHGFGVAHMVELARQMDMLPQKLIIYAITAHHFTIGYGLSADSMEKLEKMIFNLMQEEDIQRCMNKV